MGTRELHSVSTELANVGGCVGGVATFMRIEEQ